MKKTSIICLACAVLQSSAWAFPTIIWSGTQNVEIGPNAADGRGILNLDMDSNGLLDFVLEYGQDFWVSPQDGDGIAGTDAYYGPPLYFVRCIPLDAGAPVGATLGEHQIWGSDPDILAGGSGDAGVGGLWAGVDNGYMGVRFEAEDGVHYGWVRMSVSGTEWRATVHDWAYETIPGQGIMAGVVPEPSTLALFMVGVAAVAARRWCCRTRP